MASSFFSAEAVFKHTSTTIFHDDIFDFTGLDATLHNFHTVGHVGNLS